MRICNILALGAALALSACGGEPLSTAPINPASLRALASVRVDPAAATAILTAYRASHGLGPVRLDPALMAMAQREADAMIAHNALSHDVAGDFTARLLASGLDTPRAAENLGGGYYSTEDAFDGWRNSADHNANLLMPQATRFGIALAKDPRTRLRVYWAMELAAEPDKRMAAPVAGVNSRASVTAQATQCWRLSLRRLRERRRQTLDAVARLAERSCELGGLEVGFAPGLLLRLDGLGGVRLKTARWFAAPPTIRRRWSARP